MKDKLLQCVKEFIAIHHIPGKALLVGFSGGPDSLALLHLLLECKKLLPLDIHLAHVDHAWRPEESGAQADTLQEMSLQMGIPFHKKRLDPPTSQSNLESKGRSLRLEYFHQLYQKLDCQALLLGHQADDLAETVLKQLLEGANLLALNGIKPINTIEGMRVWRPLLKIRRREITAYLQEKGIHPFEDPTNRDPRFLRSRLRMEVIPALVQQFGKEVSDNLGKLAASAWELQGYLERRISPYLFQIEQLPHALSLDLGRYLPLDPLEVKGVIRALARRAGRSFSHEEVETACRLVLEKVPQRQVGVLVIDRGKIQIPNC